MSERENMRIRILLCLLALCCSSVACAQCGNPPCKENLEFTLQDKNGHVVRFKYPPIGSVYGSDGILIMPGETVAFEADETEDKPTNFRQVEKVTNPKRTLVFNLIQAAVPNDGLVMQLRTTNPFSKWLAYDLAIMPLDAEGFQQASACPVKAGSSAVETWSTPIYKIDVIHMRFLKALPKQCDHKH
jgi:hypothetical protein